MCVLCFVVQEREGRKDMEPRSEDGQFEEVTVQQLPRAERGGNPVSTHAHTHTPPLPMLLSNYVITITIPFVRPGQNSGDRRPSFAQTAGSRGSGARRDHPRNSGATSDRYECLTHTHAHNMVLYLLLLSKDD